ncbi:hypothetical protein PVAG01_00892 [Phlyctema vagabunda]|uniref:OTU domain-containing protein n=1 Tax=Phlyctema vagabunda TaxID=108571 RepID=A0ABR4PVK2_9HELO
MGRRSLDEFPQLKQYGLKACTIKGDGNCLFSALSDQIFGNPGEKHEVRTCVVDYMRDHPEEFKAFIPVVGAERRNPKRKNAGSSARPMSMPQVTESQRDKAWEDYLEGMGQNGKWGSDIEITAFSKAYKTNVKIFTTTSAPYIIAGGAENLPVAYIAYHTWQHYSSVRNIDGPFTGIPNVQENPLSSDEEAKITAETQGTVVVHSWMITNIRAMLPSRQIDDTRIKKAIEKCKGNIDEAFNLLSDEIISSSSGSSSIERDADSDDDEDYSGPKKRQDRRMSKGTKAAQKQKQLATKRLPSNDEPLASDTDSLFEPQPIRRKSKAKPKGKHSKISPAEARAVAAKPKVRVKLTNKARVDQPKQNSTRETTEVSETGQSGIEESLATSDTITDDGYHADDTSSEHGAPSRSQSFSPAAAPPAKKSFILRVNKPKIRQRGPTPTVSGAISKPDQSRSEIKWGTSVSPKQPRPANAAGTTDAASTPSNSRRLDQVIGIRGLTIQI